MSQVLYFLRIVQVHLVESSNATLPDLVHIGFMELGIILTPTATLKEGMHIQTGHHQLKRLCTYSFCSLVHIKMFCRSSLDHRHVLLCS